MKAAGKTDDQSTITVHPIQPGSPSIYQLIMFACDNKRHPLHAHEKAKKDSVLKDAVANAKLWETKLDAVESRVEYTFSLHVS